MFENVIGYPYVNINQTNHPILKINNF